MKFFRRAFVGLVGALVLSVALCPDGPAADMQYTGPHPYVMNVEGKIDATIHIQKLEIFEGAKPGTLKVRTNCVNLNGVIIPEEDGLAKGAKVKSFSLSADGSTLTIRGSALPGKNCYGVIAVHVIQNDTGVHLGIEPGAGLGNVNFTFREDGTGLPVDLTSLVAKRHQIRVYTSLVTGVDK